MPNNQKFSLIILVLTLLGACRHGVPGGADGGPGEGADGARRRARGHHHLLVNCATLCDSIH